MGTPGRIKIGISQCLLGDPVRYDGGHKRDAYLVDVLGQQVEWVPVCPEVEAGFGVPREPMQLVRSARHTRLITITTRRDKTRVLERCASSRVRELKSLDLSGYVLKARSPSCGIDDVPLFDRHGKVTATGMGLFARSFQKAFPLIPITDETRLADPDSRDRFLAQVFAYHRWSRVTKHSVTREGILSFHQTEAALLARCHRAERQALDRLIEQAARYRPKELAVRYGRGFLQALQSLTRPRATMSTRGGMKRS